MEPSTAGAAGFGLLKGGLLAALGATLVSVLAVLVGFTIIPLEPGNQLRDAARRLCAGLLCSFTLGPWVAAYALDNAPWMREFYAGLLPHKYAPLGTLFAAAPFLALTAIVGFWLLAIFMHSVRRRRNKDLLQIADEFRGRG